jgi:hypothetical protein
MTETGPKSTLKTYTGGCLCGAVRFEATLDLSEPVNRCNCSICTKVGGATTSMKPSAFRLLSGAESLGEFRKAGSPNHRNFCKHCGVQCFGAGDVAEMGGAFASVNVHCLDGIDPAGLTYQYWDGRYDNWAAGPRSEPYPLRA